ncbi:unnamed protein product, partial [Ectocarpus fasciculatus]
GLRGAPPHHVPRHQGRGRSAPGVRVHLHLHGAVQLQRLHPLHRGDQHLDPAPNHPQEEDRGRAGGAGGDQRDPQHFSVGQQPLRLPIPGLHDGHRGAQRAAGERPVLRHSLDVPGARVAHPGVHSGD